jgi:hypothetical protein
MATALTSAIIRRIPKDLRPPMADMSLPALLSKSPVLRGIGAAAGGLEQSRRRDGVADRDQGHDAT